MEQIQIRTIRSKHLYSKNDIKKVSEDQIHFGLKLQLIDNLEKLGAIRFIICEPDLFEKIEVIAEIKILLENIAEITKE